MRVEGPGFAGSGVRAQGSGFRVQDVELVVSQLRFGLGGLGFTVERIKGSRFIVF
jgi:hypothetical protein